MVYLSLSLDLKITACPRELERHKKFTTAHMATRGLQIRRKRGSLSPLFLTSAHTHNFHFFSLVLLNHVLFVKKKFFGEFVTLNLLETFFTYLQKFFNFYNSY